MSATKLRMGTAQKQNISVQHAYFYKHGGRRTQRPTPMNFKEWLRAGMDHYKKGYGFTYELVTPSFEDKQTRAGKLVKNLCKF